jgi:hypothetical protein
MLCSASKIKSQPETLLLESLPLWTISTSWANDSRPAVAWIARKHWICPSLMRTTTQSTKNQRWPNRTIIWRKSLRRRKKTLINLLRKQSHLSMAHWRTQGLNSKTSKRSLRRSMTVNRKWSKPTRSFLTIFAINFNKIIHNVLILFCFNNTGIQPTTKKRTFKIKRQVVRLIDQVCR